MILKQGRITSQHEGNKVFIHKAYGYWFMFDSLNGKPGTWYGICKGNDIIVEMDKSGEPQFICKDRVFAVTGDLIEIHTDRGIPADLYLIFIEGYTGQNVLGVKVEEKGRLKYIDGCTDSLLVYPPRLGDPALNHLHFPPGIDQTFHTHPSIRVGIVYRGHGVASFPDGEHELAEGDIFILEVGEEHRFRTSDSTMDIIAFHPDSDTGPTDEDHPMINRTIIEK
jgi:quercetin dioxygenase-like cupin family protein